MMARTGDRLPVNRREVLKGGIALAASTVLSAGSPAQAQPRQPIIDMHMHAWPRGDVMNMPVPCMAFPCIARPALYRGKEAVLRGTLAEMERHNVVLGVLSGAPGDVDLWVKAAPGRFLPATGIFEGVLSGTALRNVESLRSEYVSQRFKAMGEIGSQYRGMAPNDERLDPYFALAEDLDLPTLIHTLGVGAPVPTFRSALGRPLLLEDVVVRHPKLRLYFENAGYPFTDEAIALMTQYPQVHADLSTITWLIPKTAFDRHVRGLVEAGLGKHLMFGSDQMEWPETIGFGIERIESATYLTSEQKRDIFYNNAARFVRLDANGKLPS